MNRILEKLFPLKRVFTIRTKLAVLITLIIGVISLFIFAFFPARLEYQATRSIIAKAHSIAGMTAYSVSPALYFEDVESIREVFKSTRQNKDVIYIMVLDKAGNIIASYDEERALEHDYLKGHGNEVLSCDGSVYRLVAPIIHNDGEIGTLCLGLSLKDLTRSVRKSRIVIALVSLAIFLIGIVAAFGVSTVITSPLRQIVGTVEQIAGGDLSKRAVVKSWDEVGNLAASFNKMLANLEIAYSKLENVNTRLAERADELCHEIEERKQVETALKESEERLKTILYSVHTGIMIVDADTYRVVDVNPVALQMIGAERDSVIGVHCDRYISSTGKESRADGKSRGDGQTEEIVMYRSSGTTLPILKTAVTIILDGNEHLLLSFIDLSERKRLEEEFVKSQKLESVGVLAGGIAHDFNNILTAVIGNITLAKILVHDREKLTEVLASAENAAFRARDLTQQFLTFSKGGLPIKKANSITEILKESIGFILHGSNVKCDLEFSENIRSVEVDEGQISQVINNLIINATDAMPGGGGIEVKAKNTTVLEDSDLPLEEGKYVEITISDKGIGIPEENLQKIFDPYFTTKTSGNGLGLASTYSIIKRHDGHISVESVVGKGTKFTIYLPVAQEDILPEENKEEELLKGGGRVILMDDDESILCSTGPLLEYLGYEVDFARDGVEVVELYRKTMHNGTKYNAVILDLTIPGGMGGKETMEKLLKIDPGVKGIVSSGYSNDTVMSDYKKCGFAGVVTKPYNIERLSQTLACIINGR